MKQLIVFTFILSLLFIAGCTSLSPYKVPVLQGNIIEDKDIEKLRPGLTKDQVFYILGTPLASSPLQSYRWDYFTQLRLAIKILEKENSHCYMIQIIFLIVGI